MIVRAPLVVTMDGPPIADGAVLVRGNEIAEVGRWQDLRGRHSEEVRDLEGYILLPGLINAHCHLDYTNLRGTLPRGESFTDWIRAINERKREWSEEDYLRSIRDGFEEAERSGTTTMVNFEAFPELIARVESVPLRTWWLAEMIDVRAPVSATEMLEKAEGGGLAPHALFTCSRSLYQETAGIGAVMSTHLAESREEMRMFREGAGALFEFMRGIGRPMDDCGKMTPLALCLSYGALDSRWIVAHMNELTADDLRLLEGAPKFSIAHCPRSHAFFGHAKFRMQELRKLGFNICVGTDSLASNDDLSLLAELRQLAKIEAGLSPLDLIEMVTCNGAAALRKQDRLGRVAPGFAADMIAIPNCENTQNAYEKIVAFEGSVPWRMIEGRARENA